MFQELHSNEQHPLPSTSLLMTIGNRHVTYCQRLCSTRSSYRIIKYTTEQVNTATPSQHYDSLTYVFVMSWVWSRTNQWIHPGEKLSFICN